MSLGKIDIIKNISTKAQVSKQQASEVLEAFMLLIKSSSKNKKVKLTNFGTIFYDSSPERIGRNPKTKINYIISARSNLKFSASSKIKQIIN